MLVSQCVQECSCSLADSLTTTTKTDVNLYININYFSLIVLIKRLNMKPYEVYNFTMLAQFVMSSERISFRVIRDPRQDKNSSKNRSFIVYIHNTIYED